MRRAPVAAGIKRSRPSCSQRDTFVAERTVVERSIAALQPNRGTSGRTPARTSRMMTPPTKTATQSSLGSDCVGCRSTGGGAAVVEYCMGKDYISGRRNLLRRHMLFVAVMVL